MIRREVPKNVASLGDTAPGAPYSRSSSAFSWLSCSSMSPAKNDLWMRGLSQRYEIVLLPGYTRPEGLDPFDINSIWFSGDLIVPTKVWDGERMEGLFEIIDECFDPRREMTQFIKVRDSHSGEYIDDPRPEDVLKNRPRRRYDGEMISNDRFEEIRFHFDDVKMFYEKLSGESWVACSGFSDLYTHSSEERMAPKRRRETLAYRIADIAGRDGVGDLFEVKRQVIRGLKFGLKLFEKELSERPSWFMAQLDLDRRVADGETRGEVEIAYFKYCRGIPLSDREKKLAEKEEKRLNRVGSRLELFNKYNTMVDRRREARERKSERRRRREG